MICAILWPNALEPNHPDRAALLRWAVNKGLDRLGLTPDGSSPSNVWDSLADPAPSMVEAFVMARPVMFPNAEYRAELWRWLANTKEINVILVGSDHPANLISIRHFINEVFRRYLEPQDVNLVLVGRSGAALDLKQRENQLFVVGEVETLDPLYRIADVVVIPTIVGSGTPIKILDAFARGLCVSVSSFVDRSLGLSGHGFPLNRSPNDFAVDILALLQSPDARQKRAHLARKFAEKQLSTDIYDANWEKLAGLTSAAHTGDHERSLPISGAKVQQVAVLGRPKRGRRAEREDMNAD
jgi:Glycosyl transferases group 1